MNHIINRSANAGNLSVHSNPSFAFAPRIRTYHIVVRDQESNLVTFWRRLNGDEGVMHLTAEQNFPKANGDPFVYAIPDSNTCVFLFHRVDHHICSIYIESGEGGMDDLSGTANAPLASNNQEDQTCDPIGYYNPANNSSHVFYKSTDGHVQEIVWIGAESCRYGGDLNQLSGASPAKGKLFAFPNGQNTNILIYRDQFDHIRSIYWNTDMANHGTDDLSGVANSPLSAGDPVGYYTSHNDTHQVYYIGNDHRIYEIYWAGNSPVIAWVLDLPAGIIPRADSLSAYYWAAYDLKYVVFASLDGSIYSLVWGDRIPSPQLNTLITGNDPKCKGKPVAFSLEGATTDFIVYKGVDDLLYECQYSIEVPYISTQPHIVIQ